MCVLNSKKKSVTIFLFKTKIKKQDGLGELDIRLRERKSKTETLSKRVCDSFKGLKNRHTYSEVRTFHFF